jgi:hypothetical protein
MELMGAAMIVFGLLWAGGFGFAHLRTVAKARAAESWPSALGRIAGVEVVEERSTRRRGHRRTWFRPLVRYSYSAGGLERRGSRLRFGDYRCSTRSKAEAMLAPYAVGSSAAVRYNPHKPDESVLETGKPRPIYLIMALFGLFFVAFGLFWISVAG